jgi:hypothetical protein
MMNECRRRKQGPSDIVDVSWAIGKFFLCSFHFFVINYFFRCKLVTGMTKTMKRGTAMTRNLMTTGPENQDHGTVPHPPGMATAGDGEEGTATTTTTTTTR